MVDEVVVAVETIVRLKKNATIWKRLQRSSFLVVGLPMPTPPSCV
jgi:hypothetical protein